MMNRLEEIARIDEAEKQREEINQRLTSKDYLLTVYQTGDKLMSEGDRKRQANPQRFYADVSLAEIPDYISKMQEGWWEHDDLKEGSKVNPDDIPSEEKKCGIYWNIVIEPMTEQLESEYLDASKRGFFATHRRIQEDELRERKMR